MKREASTSTIGRDEARKPLMAAYIFQRRVLFGASLFMVVSLIIWIVAMSTDHWNVITGGDGIFIPERGRFFMSSHSGLWRNCRYTKVPTAELTARVVRNFTSFGYLNADSIQETKRKASSQEYIQNFSRIEVPIPLLNFTQEAKKRMFAHWVRNEETDFEIFKKHFKDLVLINVRNETVNTGAAPIIIDPLNVDVIIDNGTFGSALQELVVKNKSIYLVMPVPAQLAIFSGWIEKPYASRLLYSYIKDLGMRPIVLNKEQVILQLVPPKPPKGKKTNEYNYTQDDLCKNIDMFPGNTGYEFGFDEQLMDYIRMQASFACITVFIMCLGAIFSFYTFMNPRYMFKRLAGGIHFIAASTAFVVIQLIFTSSDYTKNYIFYAYPKGAEHNYGYGVYLAWFVFAVNLLCGLMFLLYSGKKKGEKAPTDEIAMADEPTIIGR